MGTNGFSLIGLGLYTAPEASRLSSVSVGRIRRWLRGYTFRTETGLHKSPPVATAGLPPTDALTVTFLDLQELRFIDAFLEAGVKWKTLRLAHEKAEAALGSHPFARGKFVTDGQRIFYDLAPGTRDGAFLEMVSNQSAFKRVVSDYIVNLRFGSDGQAAEWWPLGKSKLVVLDPHRSFGQPIVAREGVATSILAKLYRAEQSFTRVARWYNVSERAVRHAVEYEDSLAAA